jgi:orotate phosphoribosyltransferase
VELFYWWTGDNERRSDCAPASRIVGLALGAVIIAAAVMTVLRHRDFSHLVPLSVFVALIALAWTLS